MNSINEAMIFAAGFGKRMLPLTKNTPKPLLRINNKSIISLALYSFLKLGNLIILNSKKFAYDFSPRNLNKLVYLLICSNKYDLVYKL